MPQPHRRRSGISPFLWLACLLIAILMGLPLLRFGLLDIGKLDQSRTDDLRLQQSAEATNSRFRCQTVPPEVEAHLEAGLDIPFGSLRGARFVNARLDFDTWVIGADVQGWGYWGSADDAVWTITSDYAMNRPTLRTSDPITSLNALAAQHSAFPFDAKNPGTIDEAIGCARTAIWQL